MNRRKTPKVMRSTRKHRLHKQKHKNKRKTMSRTRAQYGANANIQEISFSIPMRILNGRTNVTPTAKLLNSIKANFVQNARTNTSGEIINSDGEIIKLHRVDIAGTTITLYVEGADVDSLKKAEDVIWAVMPAAYSDDIDHRFSFNVDGAFSTKTYYVDILDTPTDISWSNSRPVLK
jgi:hypothetical protein